MPLKEEKIQDMPKKDAVAYNALFGFAQSYKKPNGQWAFKFLWGRIFALLAAVAVSVWLLLSLAIYMLFKYTREYDEMTFAQAVVMPFKRAEHARMVGDFHIKKAKELLEQGKRSEAFKMVSMGVRRSPKNLDGKLMLAWFYIFGMNRYDYAILALDSGFPEAKEHAEYIKLYIKVLMEQSEDEKLVRLATKLLNMGVKNDECRLNLAMALATVYALHGNYEKSSEYLKEYGLDASTPGMIREAKNYWEQGLREEAVEYLKGKIPAARNKEAVYAMLMSFYNIMEDYDSARQYAVLRSIESPLSVKQRVDYLKLLSKSGEKQNAANQIELVFEQYKNDPKSLIYIANFAAVEGNLGLMKRIYDTALRRNYPIAPFCLLYLEAMLSLGDFKSAAAFAEEIMREKPLWSKRYEDVLKCLRAVAYYATDSLPMAEVLLDEVVKKDQVPVKTLIATARRLDKLGGTMLAYKLLNAAVNKDPKHLLALTRLVQMDIRIGNSTNLSQNVSRLLKMRRPPRELIADAQQNLNSDKFIFAQNRDAIMNEITVLVTRSNSNNAFSTFGEDLDGDVSQGVGESF